MHHFLEWWGAQPGQADKAAAKVYLLLFTMFHLAKCMRPPNPGTLLWVMAPVYPLVDLPGYLQMLIHPHIGKDFPDPLRDWWSSGTALSMWLQPDDTARRGRTRETGLDLRIWVEVRDLQEVQEVCWIWSWAFVEIRFHPKSIRVILLVSRVDDGMWYKRIATCLVPHPMK